MAEVNFTRSVCVICAGHITTCPRMMKAAEALDEKGYRVVLVSSQYNETLSEADSAYVRDKKWDWHSFTFNRSRHFWNYARTGFQHRLARVFARMLGPSGLTDDWLGAASARVYGEIVALAEGLQVDMY